MTKNIFLLFVAVNTFCSAARAQRTELIIPATHEATAVAVSADDKWMVSAGAGGIKIWDNKLSRLIKNLSPGSRDNDRFSVRPVTLCISGNSSMLAMQVADTVYLFNFAEFNITQKIKVDLHSTAMVFSADAASLYIGGTTDGGGIAVEKINTNTGNSNSFISGTLKNAGSHEVTSLSLSPSGSELLIYDAVTGSWLADAGSGSIKKQFTDPQGFFPYRYTATGNLIAFTGKAEKGLVVAELDKTSFRQLRRSKVLVKDINRLPAMQYTVAYPSASGKILFYYEFNYVVFDPADFTAGQSFKFPPNNLRENDRTSVAFTPAGNAYVQGSNMTRYAVFTNASLAVYGLQPLDSYVQFVFKDRDAICMKDRILSFDNGVFNMRIIDPDQFRDNSSFLYRLTADGKTGFFYNPYSGLYRFDPALANGMYEPVAKINNMKKRFVGMQIFDKLNLMALIGDDGIFVMDLTTLKVLYIVDIPYGMHYASNERLDKFCDISADNSKMILYAESKEDSTKYIACVDLSDRNGKWFYSAPNINNLRFADHDKKLLFTSNDKLIALDAETGKETGTVVELPRSDYPTIISPAGIVAATQIPISLNTSSGSDIGIVDIRKNVFTGKIQGTGDDVRGLVFLRNERYLLTEEFGGLCIWDLEKKRKIAKIYMFEGSPDWVMLAPDGRFDATPGALKKMYFTRGSEVIPLESLYEKFYVPGLLRQVWDKTLPNEVPDINNVKSLPLVKMSLAASDRNLEVADDISVVKLKTERGIIKVEADGLTDLVTEIRLYQNGKLVNGTRNLTVDDDVKGEKKLTKTFEVVLNTGINKFKAIAINSQRSESLPAEIIADYTPAVTPPKPAGNTARLFLLVVGVNNYKNPKYSLNYAQADADAFAAALKTGATSMFAEVNTTVIENADATRAGIVAAFDKIKALARPEDLFVFYYAGHGVMNDKNEFYLVPYDVTQLRGNDNALAQNGYSAAALQQVSKEIKAQKQLFILDACQSAGALEILSNNTRGSAEEIAISQLAHATGTQWLTASGSDQFASEFSQLGHGSFTYCLLEAFKGDGNKTGPLTVKQLDAYLQTKVPEITQKYRGTPQYPASYSYGNDFPLIIIR